MPVRTGNEKHRMRQAVLQPVQFVARSLAALFYPPTCEACEAPAPEGASLCVECEAKLWSLTAAPACALCGMPVPDDEGPCAYCLGKGVPHFEEVIRLGVFRDPLRRVIHRAKYHRRWPAAELLGDRMLNDERCRSRIAAVDLIVPVPLHPRRHFRRGYNQAELIARRLSRGTGVRLLQPIERVLDTPTQTAIQSHAKRATNVRDAFALTSPRHIAGQHVLVVDDVMTTGATLQAVARALAEARPSRLSALVLAIADPRHGDFSRI